jgi:hypothetical protein
VKGIAQQFARACDASAGEQAVREQSGAGAEASESGLGMKARVPAKVVELQRRIAPYYDPKALDDSGAGAGESGPT